MTWPTQSKLLQSILRTRIDHITNPLHLKTRHRSVLRSRRACQQETISSWIEHVALHSASQAGGAQFYISCAQLTVTGGGSKTPTNLVSFPGAYKATDPGLVVNIYNSKSLYPGRTTGIYLLRIVRTTSRDMRRNRALNLGIVSLAR